jgi:hypothetical protein
VLTLEGVREAVMQQMHAGNIEVRARPAGGGARGLCAARATVAPRRPRRGAPHALPALTTPKPSPPAPPPPPPQVNIVGDFEAPELEELCLAYLGTVAPSDGAGTPADRLGGAHGAARAAACARAAARAASRGLRHSSQR